VYCDGVGNGVVRVQYDSEHGIFRATSTRGAVPLYQGTRFRLNDASSRSVRGYAVGRRDSSVAGWKDG
jgi:hypothetical protein